MLEKIKNLTFKNNAPFRSCISKINSTFIDNPEDLDIVMPMYNLLEYSDNNSIASGSLCNYYTGNNGNRINNNKTITIKSLEYKTKIIGSMPNINNRVEAEVVVL